MPFEATAPAARPERAAKNPGQPLGQSAQRRLDARSVEWLDPFQLVARGGDDRRTPVQQGGVGMHVPEEKAGEVGVLPEALDLLLHERHAAADEVLVEFVATFPQV